MEAAHNSILCGPSWTVYFQYLWSGYDEKCDWWVVTLGFQFSLDLATQKFTLSVITAQNWGRYCKQFHTISHQIRRITMVGAGAGAGRGHPRRETLSPPAPATPATIWNLAEKWHVDSTKLAMWNKLFLKLGLVKESCELDTSWY